MDQKLNCSFELPSSLTSSLGALSAVAESPPLMRTAPHKLDGSPATVGALGHSSESEAVGESLHRSELERSLEASTRYSDMGEEASEREGGGARDHSTIGRDVEKDLLEKLQLERRHAGATMARAPAPIFSSSCLLIYFVTPVCVRFGDSLRTWSAERLAKELQVRHSDLVECVKYAVGRSFATFGGYLLSALHRDATYPSRH